MSSNKLAEGLHAQLKIAMRKELAPREKEAYRAMVEGTSREDLDGIMIVSPKTGKKVPLETWAKGAGEVVEKYTLHGRD